MDNTNIKKQQVTELMEEISDEISTMKKALEDYHCMAVEEYNESNLYFIKVLVDMLGENENNLQAKVHNLEDLFKKAQLAHYYYYHL